jgi:hypothetical protein
VKAQCERCKEIVLLDFAVAESGGGIDVSCPSCEARYFVAAAKVVKSGGGPSPPGGELCPKCAAPRGDREACSRCGLVFAKWKGAEAAAMEVLPASADAKVVGELFGACEAAWADATPHDRFIVFTQEHGALAYAAARYRAANAERGGADPIAIERLARIRTIAEGALARTTASAPPPDTAPYKNVKVVMLVLTLLLAVGAIWIVFFRPTPHEHGADKPAPVEPVVPPSK